MKKKKKPEKENIELDEEEKMIIQMVSERDKKVRVGLGTMIIGRILFGKFSNK